MLAWFTPKRLSASGISELAVGKENFALAVDDILLQVEGDSLGDAEILHSFGHGDARLLTDAEKVVYGGTTCENHGRIVQDFGSLRTEFFERDALDFDKRLVGDVNLVALSELVEGGFFNNRRLGLRYQYLSNFQCFVYFWFYFTGYYCAVLSKQ